MVTGGSPGTEDDLVPIRRLLHCMNVPHVWMIACDAALLIAGAGLAGRADGRQRGYGAAMAGR
jgi:hypothetical protein